VRRLEGRIAIVTGAGQGLGRSHALHLAAQGASVVVNDLGAAVHGGSLGHSPAQQVVDEITRQGGRAVASAHDVADWKQAGELVDVALRTFGDLHVLVNNAGIIRDRTLANMTETEWDDVIRVHLKGHAAPTHHALAYWRDRAKAGQEVKASVVHTTSAAGLAGNFGQANYSAAKLGIVALSRVVALEAGSYGVRSNVISPSARTRMSLSVPGGEDSLKPPTDPSQIDVFDPQNVSPTVGWLAEKDCPATAQIFHIIGNRLLVMSMPAIAHDLRTERRWKAEELDRELRNKLVKPPLVEEFIKC
jgi:NAD(P)-dependent dehydrogenase (short-subunit alcohol dehydrogenase family)